MRGLAGALLTVSALLLTSCSDTWMGTPEDPPLPGERLSVMQLQGRLEIDPGLAATRFVLPGPRNLSDWPQAGGLADHALGHVALSSQHLTRLWSADIGDGSRARNPLTAQPVIQDGRLFTLDTSGNVTAFATQDGDRLWRADVGAEDEDDTVLGGGLAVDGARVYVTNGYAEMVALNAEDGARMWRVPLPTPARAAPVAVGDLVYVVTMDNRVLALNAADGAAKWDYRGVSEGAGLLGAAAPAVAEGMILAPLSTGEIVALDAQTGALLWMDRLAAPIRLGGARGLADMRAMPVVDRGLAFAMSYGGRLAAIDVRTGARIWQRDIGGKDMPIVAGDDVFVMSADQQLIALHRGNGAIRWITQLDQFKDPQNRVGALVWNGPVLAGGHVMVMGDTGRVLRLNPATGQIIDEWDMGDTLATPVVIVDQTLYALTQNGTLSAWR